MFWSSTLAYLVVCFRVNDGEEGRGIIVKMIESMIVSEMMKMLTSIVG